MYQAAIAQPQKASQVLSDRSVTDLIISAENETNPAEASAAENRTVMGNQQLIQRNWCELENQVGLRWRSQRKGDEHRWPFVNTFSSSWDIQF